MSTEKNGIEDRTKVEAVLPQPSQDAQKLAADFMYFCSLPRVSDPEQAIALLKLLLLTRGCQYAPT